MTIEFKKSKDGKSVEFDPKDLDVEITMKEQALVDNAAAMSNLQEERATISRDLDKLSAIKNSLPI